MKDVKPMKQILIKLIKRSIVGNTETIVYERIERELFTKDELDQLIDQFADDQESAYLNYGLCFGLDDKLLLIILDKLCEGLKEYTSDDEDWSIEKQIIEKAETYRSYNLSFESDSGEPKANPSDKKEG